MPNYRRARVPGATVFLTLVTYARKPILGDPAAVEFLRLATRRIMVQQPFEVVAAVVLPDHLHFVWSLPPGDSDYSTRVGRIKVEFSRLFRSPAMETPAALPRQVGEIWQPRFWEHTIEADDDLENHMDYVHYNPVKHGRASCPHAWPFSSFTRWVRRGLYDPEWGCQCDGRIPRVPTLTDRESRWGE